MMHARFSQRSPTQLRTLAVTYNIFPFAPGSVLFEMGRTKILCAISFQAGVPPFLRGRNTGWLTAEYAMLPAATAPRTTRESSSANRNGRSVEISRLIGRVLRTIIDFNALGENTIVVDCDVLQADGGTRTASINAACLALRQAQQTWLSQRLITRPFLRDGIAALAVGIHGTHVYVDPDYKEDSEGDADFNFVMTESGKIVEIQGGAEKDAVAWTSLENACQIARQGVAELFSFFDLNKPEGVGGAAEDISFRGEHSSFKKDGKEKKVPLFSLQARLKVSSVE